MGYEVLFHYHEEVSKGEYNKEETKTKKVTIGTPYEETPLSVLAGKIMAQLARRNILVVEVEIFEFTKKRLSYKESPDGILIKNKKFSFDGGDVAVMPDENPSLEENIDLSDILQNPQMLDMIKQKLNIESISSTSNPTPLPKPNLHNPPVNLKPLRYEHFDPEKALLLDARQRRLAFTVGKKYPIFKEKPAGADIFSGMMYETKDDNGKRQSLSDKFFTPIIQIDGEEHFVPTSSKMVESKLDYSGYVDPSQEDMTPLR